MSGPVTSRIKRLNTISGFGLYKNFTWDAVILPDFGRYNLVYGWNYSGKTTLSRIIQALQYGANPPECALAAFSFELADGSHIATPLRAPVPTFRVFNRDFVDRNFHPGSDMTGTPSIAVIGEENQRLKDRLAFLERRRSRIDEIGNRFSQDEQAIQQQIDSAATDQARIVNAIFGDRYRRDHLFADVGQLPPDHTTCILHETQLSSTQEEWRKADDYEVLPLLQLSH